MSACALAQKACRDGYSALYMRAVALFRDLSIARADGSLRSLLVRLSRIDVLVIDDWAMAPLAETERRDFWEICEDRYQTRSTILTSQLPVVRVATLRKLFAFGPECRSRSLRNQRSPSPESSPEAVPVPDEETNIDVLWATTDGVWTFCEVKLSEADFGKAPASRQAC